MSSHGKPFEGEFFGLPVSRWDSFISLRLLERRLIDDVWSRVVLRRSTTLSNSIVSRSSMYGKRKRTTLYLAGSANAWVYGSLMEAHCSLATKRWRQRVSAIAFLFLALVEVVTVMLIWLD